MSVCSNTTAAYAGERSLGLGSLGLFAPFFGGLLLLHLLVAQSGKGAGNLLDLVALAVFDDLLEVLLSEEDEVSLLVVASDQRGGSIAKRLELSLSSGVEN